MEKSKPNLKAMGDAIWKDAEKAKITSRSWQSMKNRFKVREPTIESCFHFLPPHP
jgi:hypothetical protein